MSLSFLTPVAALVALVGLLPLLAVIAAVQRAERVRRTLELPGRPRSGVAPAAAIAFVAGLVGAAAAQPIVTTRIEQRVRTDAEAFVVLDTSRSMLARDGVGAASRLARAKTIAAELRAAVAEVPVGLASFTDRTLPHLFPSADATLYTATLGRSIGIERPPPAQSFSATVSRLDALAAVATRNFFAAAARRRLLVVLTDGESVPGARARVGPVFARPPGIETVFVHVWGPDERVFRRGVAEPAYLPDPAARATLERFAAEVGGTVFDERDVGSAADAIRDAAGSGPTVLSGERERRLALAPALLLAAFVPLGLTLWRRDR